MKLLDRLAFSYIPAAIAMCMCDIESDVNLTHEELAVHLDHYAKGAGFPMKRITLTNKELALRVGNEHDVDALIIPLGWHLKESEQKMALAV